MRKTISKVATAIAVAVLSSAIIISCGPEEQPGGNNGGGNDDVPATPSTIAVTGVSLNKSSLSLEEGGSESLVATVAPSNATNKSVNWTSSAPGVATVDGNGKVTAVKAGSATITVTTSDGSKTSKCEVKVSAKIIEVESIVVTPETAEIFEGETVTLSATISPENASDKSFTWVSRSQDIAVVDNKGVVTGVSNGFVYIDAKAGNGTTGTCGIHVKKDLRLKGIALSKSELEVTMGKTEQLEVVFTPADAENKNVTWESSDNAVATVSSTGEVLGLDVGEATITATSEEGGFKATCKVKVLAVLKPGVYWVQNRYLYRDGEDLNTPVAFGVSIDPAGDMYYCSMHRTNVSNTWHIFWNGVPYLRFDENCNGTYSTSGGGYYFIPDYNTDHSVLRTWKIDPKAGEIKDIEVYRGPAHSFWINDMAADSKGNLYLAGYIENIPDYYTATLWKIDSNDNVTKTSLSSGTSKSVESVDAVALNKNGDVFCLVWDGSYGYDGYCYLYLYKNGKKQYLVTSKCSRQYTQCCDMAVLGNDVYILVNEYNGQNTSNEKTFKNQVYKNKSALYDLKHGVNVYSMDIAVTSKGDVYCSGFQSSGKTQYYIWKNGKVLYTPSEIIFSNSLAILE
ncbi:MAG: Ig-like domain-containing protein [Bacteroidales bacterium]|nr:Ig-like domain-containing protein [Bacteroidales bacterium]